MGIKTLFAGVAAISAALCANADGLSGDTGTTFAGLTAGTQFKASEQAENNKYFWRTAEATSVGTIESYTTLGAYSGTRAAQWGSDASGVALKLDTETPLFRYAEGTDTADGATSTIDANGVYIDTLVQFGVYYETPEMVSDAKFGIWGQEIDGTVKLVVRAGKYDGETLTADSYIIDTASGFNFEAWHRITVKTAVRADKTWFKLFIDGEAAVATTGETEFPGLAEATTISSLVFNGCGAVDDILFTKTVPEMDAIAQVGGTYFATLADAVAGANGATVTLLKSSSENITIQAGDTLKILPASGGVSYTGQVSIGDNNYNVVMATDPTTGEITYSTEKKGMILLITQGGDEPRRYGTLAEAVAAATAGDTIKLLEAVALTSTINITKNLTLNLNGFNVTATDCRAFHVQGGATAITGTGTISTIGTQGTALASSSSVIRVGSNTAATQFTLGKDVTVTSPYCYGITYFGTQPQTVTIDGTVSVSGEQAAISGNGSSNLAATTLVVNGTVTATHDYAIYNPQAGTTTINGTVNGGIEVKAGAVTIADGATVSALSGATPSHSMNNNGTSTSGYAIAAVGNSSYKQPASAEIQQGATVDGQVIVLAENNSSTSGNIASYSYQIAIPADYKWVDSGEGYYTLVEKTYVAQIGNNKYESFAEAFSAAQAGDTITLLANLELTSTINITKDLTLDLNGFNVTATDCRAFHVQGGITAIAGTGTISTIVTQGTAFASSSSVIRVGSNTAATQFTLGENVTVTSPYCYGITYFGTQPQTVTIDGIVSVTGVQAAISGNGSSNLAATTLVVNGTVTATQDYAIYNPQAGTTTINGTVNGGIEVKAGAVTIADGATVSALAGAKPSHSMNNNGTSTSGYAIAAVGNSSYKQPASAEIRQGATVNGQVIVLAENNSTTSGNIASYSNKVAIPEGYVWNQTQNGYELALAPSGYDSGDGVTTFTIDETAETSVKEKTGAADLGALVPGKTYSYAQAYAAGLIDLTAEEPIKELTPVIEVDPATNKVKVGFDTKPLNGFTVTFAVYAATEPGDVDKAEAQNFVVDGNGEAQLTAPIDRATNETKKFYKVKIVKIENK